MAKDFSKDWKASKRPSKQRKYSANAPLHIKNRMLQSPLSKELRTKYKRRNIRVKKDDKVKVVRGQYKKTVGKVVKVDTKKKVLFVDGIEFIKKDGSKSQHPINPTNVIIEELNLEDKKRKIKLEGPTKK